MAGDCSSQASPGRSVSGSGAGDPAGSESLPGHIRFATARGYVQLRSIVSRMMSAWPACRAVSSIMCTATHRRFPAMSGHAHGASRSTVLRISCEAAICSR